jgi:uncharacterized protein YbjT (DUF2867 family)
MGLKLLVTGATGYIGGRLIHRLLERGHQVRVLVRDPRRLEGRGWDHQVEVHVGNLMDPESLRGAFEGVDAAYYLVHSMYGGDDFAEADRRAAQNFVEAAKGQGLPHTIYLGGILPHGRGKIHSEHLRSRAEVGAILREGLAASEIRAGPIIGSGSASFEMVRYIAERVPVIFAPHWILQPVRPVGIRNILLYLIAVAERGEALGVMDVGTAPLSFRKMVLEYAKVRGLRRVVIPIRWKFYTPKLSGLLVGLVTPITNDIALPLVEGVVQPVVGNVNRARALFPEIQPQSYRQSVSLALERVETGEVRTRWGGALPAQTSEVEDREGIRREVRSWKVKAPPAEVFRIVKSLGGERGWLFWDWAWGVRGFIDQLFGGPGTRRGRRHPEELRRGETVDFWRVEEIQPNRLLRLRAETRAPGRTCLEWQVLPEDGGTRLIQSILFTPSGLRGILFWFAIFPFHGFIFPGMARQVVRLAEERAGTRTGLDQELQESLEAPGRSRAHSGLR